MEDDSADSIWEVVGGADKGGILVRRDQSTASSAFGSRLSTGARVQEIELVDDRLHYKRLSGDGPDYGWVTTTLGSRELMARVDTPRHPPGKKGRPKRVQVDKLEPVDEPQVSAADVLELLERELREADRRRPPTVSPLDLRAAAAGAETAAASAGAGGDATMIVNLEEARQEGVADTPQDVKSWLDDAHAWLVRLDPQLKVPAHVRLPVGALGWEPAAAVLFARTHGQFDLERDICGTGARGRPRQPGLVSVVCATSDRRRSFHSLLYKSFCDQRFEPMELVVVHTGEMPSEFFQEAAEADARVTYRFFPVTREAPGSPRLSDESAGNPWAAVLDDDQVDELTRWGEGHPLEAPIKREGWTKGLKRNVGACIARGDVIAHFDDGCLYAPDYIGHMRAELAKLTGGEAEAVPAAVALSRWYTLAVKDQDFRLVDLRRNDPVWDLYGRNPTLEREKEQFSFGFSHMYTRSAWQQQPFKDTETVATGDGMFMRSLRADGAAVSLAPPPGREGLAACGWHRDATCGAVDAPANINYSTMLSILSFRGEDVDGVPKLFKACMPAIKEIASDLTTRRERYLRDLVEDHGSVHVCAYCNFAVAMHKNAQGTKHIDISLRVVDAVDMMQTYDKEHMKFECGYFSDAGGAVAEGDYEQVPPGHGWLSGRIQRMAICRNCGWQLGWRYEPEANKGTWNEFVKLEKAARRESNDPWSVDITMDDLPPGVPPLQGPVAWCLIWRHLRERVRPGEHVPEDGDKGQPRHRETEHNRLKSDVCPSGHQLRCFSTGQGNGGALPLFYTCDVCDKDARWNEHLWGCGTCDYDLCAKCKRERKPASRSLVDRTA